MLGAYVGMCSIVLLWSGVCPLCFQKKLVKDLSFLVTVYLMRGSCA